MQPARQVLLFISPTTAYEQNLIHGISSYAATRSDWSFAIDAWGEIPAARLAALNCDGVIMRPPSGVAPLPLASLGGIPAVNCSAEDMAGMPQVIPDDHAIGVAGADHLLQKGFRHFAFRGDPAIVPSAARCAGFVERLRQAGYPCHELGPGPEQAREWRWDGEVAETIGLLRNLPRPLGLMTFNGLVARRVLDACKRGGIRVPEDVAVLAGEDDPLVGAMSRPQLSGIALGTERVGWQAAALLDRLMAGETLPTAVIRVPPVRVNARLSTDILAVEDEDLANALRFIREHACTGIGVGDVLRAVPISRRSLELRFRAHLNRTPAEEIRRIQVERARQLLADTDLPMPQIAATSGFSDAARFSAAFHHRTGETPTQYRRGASVG